MLPGPGGAADSVGGWGNRMVLLLLLLFLVLLLLLLFLLLSSSSSLPPHPLAPPPCLPQTPFPHHLSPTTTAPPTSGLMEGNPPGAPRDGQWPWGPTQCGSISPQSPRESLQGSSGKHKGIPMELPFFCPILTFHSYLKSFPNPKTPPNSIWGSHPSTALSESSFPGSSTFSPSTLQLQPLPLCLVLGDPGPSYSVWVGVTSPLSLNYDNWLLFPARNPSVLGLLRCSLKV